MLMVDRYPIILDSREQDNVRQILDSYGIEYTIEALPVGDYEIRTPDGEVTIERKQMTDFISSLFSDRLEDQMRRLSQKPCPILLLTGSFAEYRRYAKTTNFTADQVVGAVASCIVKYGLRCVVWVQSANNAPHATGISLATKLMRKISEGKLDQIPDRKLKKNKGHPQRELVHLIFGVPSDVAQNILDKFSTLRKALNASDEELLTVKGMGKTRLLKMHKMLGDA